LYTENRRREEKERQTKGIFLWIVFSWYNPRKKRKANNELCYTCTPHPPFIIKKISFKEKVVFDVTSETTFSLKLIFFKKKGRQREMRSAFLAFLTN
jgi:hypothetical protein